MKSRQDQEKRDNERARSMAQVQAYSSNNPYTLMTKLQQIPTNQSSASYQHQVQQTQRQHKK